MNISLYDFRKVALPTLLISLFGLTGGLLKPVISPFVKGAGLTNIQVSLVFAFFPLSLMVFAPVVGRLSDRIGRYRVILFGAVLYIASMTVFLYASSFLLFVVAQVLSGAAVTSIAHVGLAAVEDQLDNAVRATYSGISLSLRSAAITLGSLAGGVIAETSIRLPFFFSIGVVAVIGVAAYWRKEEQEASVSGSWNLLGELKTFLSRQDLRAMGVLGFFMHAKGEAITVFFPLFALEALGVGYTEIGVALFFLGGFHALQFLFGPWIDRYPRQYLVLAGVLLSAAALSALSLATHITTVYGIFAVYSLATAVWNVSAWSLISDIGEHRDLPGETIGSYISLAKLGAVCSLAVNGFIVTLWGFRTLFMLYATVVLAAAVFATVLFRGMADNQPR